jgi:hypothetical protein
MALEVSKHLSASDFVRLELQRLADTTGSHELDDRTSRSLIKFQSRLMINKLFEKSHMALEKLSDEVVSSMSPRDLTSTIVGLIGRISTLTESITKLEQLEASEEPEWIRTLRGLPRDEMLERLRESFATLFGTLFTDEERERLFQDIGRQKTDSEFGLTGEEHESAERDAGDASRSESVGSSRWHAREGSTGILPTASKAG